MSRPSRAVAAASRCGAPRRGEKRAEGDVARSLSHGRSGVHQQRLVVPAMHSGARSVHSPELETRLAGAALPSTPRPRAASSHAGAFRHPLRRTQRGRTLTAARPRTVPCRHHRRLTLEKLTTLACGILLRPGARAGLLLVPRIRDPRAATFDNLTFYFTRCAAARAHPDRLQRRRHPGLDGLAPAATSAPPTDDLDPGRPDGRS